MNTALVISGEEWYGLIALKGRAVPEALQQLIGEMRIDTSNKADIVSTLQEKRLARQVGDVLTMEPLLNLVIEEAISAHSFHKAAPDSFALACPNMSILFTRYEWAAGMWRIAPFKDMHALLSSN